MEKFRKLGIIEPLLKSLQEHKFVEPSEIQRLSVPLILEGKDVIAGAATGSGKTLVFASVIIKECEKGKGLQSLILVPTRELAEQVSGALNRFSKHKELEIIPVYGGVSINPQIDHLETADVVVGTPGRILDHLQRETINLKHVKILVLDEADRMLDMGFIDDVEKIIRQCPKQRQTLLFSATISDDIALLAKKYMINPVEVSAEVYVDPSKLAQIYYDVEDNMKFSLLVYLLRQEHAGLAMVFCNTQRNTDFVARNLIALGINALGIHGGYSQDKRTRTMERFNAKNVAVLVCTDVAARGLDIKGVSHIYNYDIPKDKKDYIHRIGRTARAGKEGIAINIVASRDYENFRRVNEDGELAIAEQEMPQIERIFIKYKDNFQGRGRFGEGRGRFGRGGFDRERRFGRGESRGRFGHGGGRDYRRRESHGGYGRRGNERQDRRSHGYGGRDRGYGRENRSYDRRDRSEHTSHGGDKAPRHEGFY